MKTIKMSDQSPRNPRNMHKFYIEPQHRVDEIRQTASAKSDDYFRVGSIKLLKEATA